VKQSSAKQFSQMAGAGLRLARLDFHSCHAPVMFLTPVMLSGSAAQAVLESKHPVATCDITNAIEFSATNLTFHSKHLDAFVIVHTVTGSFDCARLSPRLLRMTFKEASDLQNTFPFQKSTVSVDGRGRETKGRQARRRAGEGPYENLFRSLPVTGSQSRPTTSSSSWIFKSEDFHLRFVADRMLCRKN